MDSSKNNNSEVSRRGMIKTLGLSLSLTTIPSFLVSGMTEVSVDALDHGEKIIPVEEENLSQMQKFIEDCISANNGPNAQDQVREVLARGVYDPKAMLKAVGEPTQAGLKVFLRSKELTIFAASWTPQMNLLPHNHTMWANIGIYTGREDNILWERTEDGIEGKLARCLFEGDTAKLDTNAIHSVTNPLRRFTGGIHIYGGDFFASERSQWDPETLEEQPSDGAVIKEMFRKENELMNKIKND